jgi:TonB family protein
MNELFLYLIKAAMINAIILAFYHFTLRKSNKFHLMRMTLLLAMVLPLLFPLIPYPFGQADHINLPVVIISLPETATITSAVENSLLNWNDLPTLLYYGISVVLLLGMAISISAIIKKWFRSEEHITSYGKVELEHTVKSPFSFFSWVFLSPKDLDHPQLDMILKHEFCHVREKHSIDRVLSGIFRSVLWFSPLAHITSRLLSVVHEYQADSKVIGIYNRSEYSDLILSFYLNPQTSSISNNFSLHVKKRITMINNLNFNRLRYGRIVTGLCISLSLVFLTSMVTTNDQPLASVDQNVSNSISSLEVGDHLGDTIPPSPDITPWTGEVGQKGPLGHAGTVIIKIDIQSDGIATNYRIFQSAGSVLDNFALTKLKQIKDWRPATYNDKPVKYTVMYPFNFTADGDVTISFLKGGAIIETEKPLNFNNSQPEGSLDGDKTRGEYHVKNTSDPDTVYKVQQTKNKGNDLPDSPPQYPGGDKARIEYIVANTPYPDEDRKAGIKGTVYVQFVIETTGKVTNVKILKGVSTSIDKVAFNAITNMPDWIPAKKDNKPVSYEMTMPIKFELSDDKVGKVAKDPNAGDLFSKDNSIPQKIEGSRVFTVVEVAPEFPGGDDARVVYLNSNIIYPEQARKNGIQGTVYITFVVEPDGSITGAKVLRGVGGGLDQVALEVVKKMPKWTPGKVKGEPVPVQFNMPIKFKLSDDKEDKGAKPK